MKGLFGIQSTQFWVIQLKLQKCSLYSDSQFNYLIFQYKVCAPSLIYNIQNNLYYIALSNLESTTFCVVYQLKILTTALMLRYLLGKQISTLQWIALVILVFGVAIVQSQYEPPVSRSTAEQSVFIGFVAVIVMCISSAFAGEIQSFLT